MLEYDSTKIMQKLKDVDAKNSILSTTSDIRRSDTFALMFMDCLRYSPERKSWFYYNGKMWQMDKGGMIASELCKKLVNQLVLYCNNEIDDNEQYQYMRNAIQWQKLSVRESIIRDARSVMPIDASEFDSNDHLLNLNNGTFNLKTGLLQEHSPDDMITKLAPVDFVQGADNERWNTFITEIMSDDMQKVEFLQRALGYSLSGSTNQECLFFLYGESTRNGKGTLMESIMGVMGDYSSAVRPETIANSTRSSNSHSEDLARLQGIRLANISEPPKAMQLNSALVKTLTGGDTINARFLNENSFDYKPQFKLYINTNHLPSVNDYTVFSSDRIFVIPFNRHFSPQEQDKSLKQLFSTDEIKSAILNWLIIGYYKAQNGFGECQAVQNAVAEYRQNSDYIYNFITNVLIYDKSGKTPVFDAHRQYTNWAIANNHPQYDIRVFGKKINKYVNTKVCKIGNQSFRCISYDGYDKKIDSI